MAKIWTGREEKSIQGKNNCCKSFKRKGSVHLHTHTYMCVNVHVWWRGAAGGSIKHQWNSLYNCIESLQRLTDQCWDAYAVGITDSYRLDLNISLSSFFPWDRCC